MNNSVTKERKYEGYFKKGLALMHKQRRWIIFTVLFIFLIFSVNTTPGFAKVNNDDGKNEGKVMFIYKTDFEDLYRFLGVTKQEFKQLRKEKSIVEIAKEKGISEDKVFRYFISKKFDAYEVAYKKGDIDLRFIMDSCIRLKNDVEWEINVKKSKDGTLTTQ